MKKYLSLLLLILVSCSTMTKNAFMKGDLTLKGGVSRDKRWEDSLVMTRASWFKELTMYFDVFYTHIDDTSPFYNWFSESEKDTLKGCVDIIVTASYAFRPRDISKTMFRDEMEKFGYTGFTLNEFERNLRMHPDFARYQMGVYSTHAYCRKGMQAKNIVIGFPGFDQVNLD